MKKEFEITDGILHHKEKCRSASGKYRIVSIGSNNGECDEQELIMKEYIEAVRTKYDYILIDCMPSLGLMTINALVAADSVLIPVQAGLPSGERSSAADTYDCNGKEAAEQAADI